MEDSCRARFIAELGDGEVQDAAACDDGLDAALDDLLARARSELPEIPLDENLFVAHVARRSSGTQLAATLQQLRAGDLHLACACLEGVEAARVMFVNRFGPVLDATLAQLRGFGTVSEDVRAQLVERLLFARQERPPAIALYGGQGDLAAYLRVAALREGIRLIKKNRRESTPRNFDIGDLSAPEPNPEIVVLKARYRHQFKHAFQTALGTLKPRDRTLLRYHYLDALTTREIGGLYGAHSSTVTRWLAAIRAKLFIATKVELMKQLALRTDEFASVARLVESQLDISIASALADGPMDDGSVDDGSVADGSD